MMHTDLTDVLQEGRVKLVLRKQRDRVLPTVGTRQ